MGTSKGGLARDSRGIEHPEAQDAECSGHDVLLSVSRSVEYEACVSVTFSDMKLSGNSVKLVFSI
jgi:hypothetical protein